MAKEQGQRRGLIIGIIVAALLVIALVGGSSWYFLGNGSESGNRVADSKSTASSKSSADSKGSVDSKNTADSKGSVGRPVLKDDGKTYQLTAPTTVLGDYKLNNPGETDDDITHEQMIEFGIRRAHAIDADYRAGAVSDGLNEKQIDFNGLWGKVADPHKSVDSIFARLTDGMGPGAEADAIGSPKLVNPDGLDNAVMKCQVIRWTVSGETMCVWVDYGTIGVVSSQKRNQAVHIDHAARIAADLRDELRQEVK